MYRASNVRIISTNDEKIRECGDYETHYYSCQISCRNHIEENGNRAVALYECHYTFKRENGVKRIENVKSDIHTKVNITTEEEYEIADVTEVFPTEKGDIIQATINVYKQKHVFGNKKYFGQLKINVM